MRIRACAPITRVARSDRDARRCADRRASAHTATGCVSKLSTLAAARLDGRHRRMHPRALESQRMNGDDELDALDAYWRAANYLTVGQIYLMANPLLREPLRPEHIKPRLLGHWGTSPGLSLIYAHLNRVIRAPRRQHDAAHRARPRRPGDRRQRLPRGHVLRDLSRGAAGRARARAAVPAVLDAGRRAEPRRAADPGLDPRGRRARLRARPRVRRGVRQPRSDRGRGGRRRRGRDRPAGGLVEGRQVPERGARRRGAADPAPQRLQDLRADRARPGRRRRDPPAVRGPRLRGPPRRRQRAAPGAPPARERARRVPRSDPLAAEQGADPRCARRGALADDRAAHAQGLDRPEGRERPAGRGHVSRPPGPARRCALRIRRSSRRWRRGCGATRRIACSIAAAG